MPVVRELVNRISFKVSSADKKNAESAMDGMQKRAKGVLATAGKIGKALTASLAGLTISSTKLFTDFEKDTGAAAFFARSAKEARELNKLLDEVSDKSETTSRREARRASKVLAQTTLTQKQIRDFIPFLEKISVARPDLDFTGVSENFRDVVSGGDLGKMTDLVVGFKDTAELLSKTTFGKPFGDITEVQRGEILLDALLKNQPKLEELAKQQQETLNIQFSKAAKQSSDFALQFGETIAPAVSDSLKLLTGLIKELNESEKFWKAVESGVKSVQTVLETIKGLLGPIDANAPTFTQEIAALITDGDPREINLRKSAIDIASTGQTQGTGKGIQPVALPDGGLLNNIVNVLSGRGRTQNVISPQELGPQTSIKEDFTEFLDILKGKRFAEVYGGQKVNQPISINLNLDGTIIKRLVVDTVAGGIKEASLANGASD